MQNKTHLGVYGIIFIQNKLVVIKKARGEYTGLFDLPGGTPEFLESFEDTLVREIYEETGLKITEYELLKPVLNIGVFDDVTLRHVGIIFRVTKFTGELKTVSDGEDSNGCVLLDMNEISENNCTPFVCKAIG